MSKVYHVTTDNEGALPLPAEIEPNVRIGDEYAVWEEGKSFVLVFKKELTTKIKIPKHAQWGKVEPALPEILVTLPKPAKAAKAKRQKCNARSRRKK